MKKKTKILFPLGAIAFLGVVASFTSVAKPVNASVFSKTVIEDKFNKEEYRGDLDPSIWTSNCSLTSKIAQDELSESYLQQNSSLGATFFAFGTRNKHTNIKKITFDFFFKSGAKIKEWCELLLTNEKEDFCKYGTGNDPDLAYNGIGRFAQSSFVGGCLCKLDGSSFSYSMATQWGLGELDAWATIEYEITSSSTLTVNMCKQGESMDPSKAIEAKIDYNNPKLKDYVFDLENSYISLNVSTDGGEIRFDNLKIESDQTIISEDPTDPTIKEYFVETFDDCDPFDEDSLWDAYYNPKSGQKLEDFSFNVISNSTLTFADAAVGDFIYTNAKIEDTTNGVKEIDLFNLSFVAKMASKNDKIAIIFGYDPDVDSLTTNTTVYEIDKFNGVLKEFDENGEQTTLDEENTNKFTTSLGTEVIINISLNKKEGFKIKANDVDVSKDGKFISYEMPEHYLGHIAIACLKQSGSGSDFYIDTFKVDQCSYYKPITKSVTHDFSDDYFGNVGYEDFIVQHYTDTITDDVSVNKDEGKLTWKCATDGTMFGSAHQYDNFILDFKLTSLYADPNVTSSKDITQRGNWIGLDLSRENPHSTVYGKYLTVLTMFNPEPNATKISNAVWSQPTSGIIPARDINISYNQPVDREIFNAITYKNTADKSKIKPEDAVCFRYISENGNLSLYIKKNSDVTFTRYLTLKNIKLQGYFAICCTGYTYMDIDDFSMTNTSPIYEVAPTYYPEPIIQIKTEFVNETDNFQKNLDEEIQINKSNDNLGLIISCSVGGAAVIGLTTALIIVLRKKKHEK